MAASMIALSLASDESSHSPSRHSRDYPSIASFRTAGQVYFANAIG